LIVEIFPSTMPTMKTVLFILFYFVPCMYIDKNVELTEGESFHGEDHQNQILTVKPTSVSIWAFHK